MRRSADSAVRRLENGWQTGFARAYEAGCGRYGLADFGATRDTCGRISFRRGGQLERLVRLRLLSHTRTRGRVACSSGRLTSTASRRSVCDRRQGELKAGAAGQVRARPQPAAVRFDDRTADRQAHPQTARLRGVDGRENVLESLRREAWTPISHLD